jgi:hypothetical protein
VAFERLQLAAVEARRLIGYAEESDQVEPQPKV